MSEFFIRARDADMHTHFCDAACTARDCVWHPGSTALVHNTTVWFLNTRKADREPTCAWAIHARSHARKHAGIFFFAGCGRGLQTDHETGRGLVVCAVLTSPHNFLRTTRAANAKPCIVLRWTTVQGHVQGTQREVLLLVVGPM